MNVVDYLLEGLEAELTLARELGMVRVELDRSLLLAPQPKPASKPMPAPQPALKPTPQPKPQPVIRPTVVASSAPEETGEPRFDFIFLHHKPLSADGLEMMEKIVRAMGRTPETAPIVTDAPLPRAKIVIVLGQLALRKFYPEVTGGAPGQWLGLPGGRQILITNSPDYILRFKVVTQAVQQIKKNMWASLKSVVQKLSL